MASESAFTVGGRVIDPHYASLGTDTVEFLTCGANWFNLSMASRGKER